MKITIETKKSSRRNAARIAQERQLAEAVLRNFKAEIDSNPELLETVYTDDMSIGIELQSRMEDLFQMEQEADSMAGGWRGKLAYKLSKK